MELQRCLCEFPHFLLDIDEAPELVSEPVVVRQRPLIAARQASSLKGVKTDIGEDRPIDFDRAAQPPARLIGEAILVIVNAHRAQRSLSEIEDLVNYKVHLDGYNQLDLITGKAQSARQVVLSG